jgi:hypothetical protein
MLLTVEPPPSNPHGGPSHRAHSPDTASSSGDAEPESAQQEPIPPTKSPQSQRVVKRARFTSPGPETHVDAPFLAPTASPLPPLTHQPPTARSPAEAPPSTLPLSATSCDVPADQLEHLESLVDSMLATVAVIQAASTQPVVFSPHTLKALSLLNMLVAPTPATTRPVPQSKFTGPTMLSYAQAAKGSPTTHPVEHSVRPSGPSPAGRQPSCKRAQPRPPQQPRHSAYRLIVRWPGHPVPRSSNSLQDFISRLKKRVGGTYRINIGAELELAGANVTRSGNVVIHTKAPHTASQLLYAIQLAGFEDIAYAGQAIPDFDCPDDILPEVELDVPWHGVVIHDIPAGPLLGSYRGAEALEHLWDVVPDQTGLPARDIRDLHVLCRGEELEKRDQLSIRIMLEDSRICEHLCRTDLFFLETPCRVSSYRSRKNNLRHRPRSSPPS